MALDKKEQNIGIAPASGEIPAALTPAEILKLQELREKERKANESLRVSQSGGTNIKTTLTPEQVIQATEEKPIADEVLHHPEQSLETAATKEYLNKILAGERFDPHQLADIVMNSGEKN